MENIIKRISPDHANSPGSKLDIIIECIWLLIIFLVPVYYNPFCRDSFYFAKSLLFQFLVILLLGFVLARWFLVKKTAVLGRPDIEIIKAPLQTAVLIFGLLCVVSTVFSITPYRSMWGSVIWREGLFTILCWITFFLIIAGRMKSRVQVYRALYALLISSGLVCLVGILQFLNPDLLSWGLIGGRVIGTDGNPLSLSGFIAMMLPVTLAMIVLAWYGPGSNFQKSLKFLGLLVLFLLQMVCLILAQYSLTILLFVIGMFVLFGLLGIYLRRRITLALSVFSLVLIILAAVVLMGQLMLSQEAESPVEKQNINEPLSEQVGLPSLGIRIQIWKSSTDIILRSPDIADSGDGLHFLRRAIGYGPETFIVLSQTGFPSSFRSEYTFKSAILAQPENHYLYLGITVGILGLLAFLAVLTLFFILGFRLLSASGDRETTVMISAFIAVIVQYCAHVFFNPSVISTDLMLWLILGLFTAWRKVEKQPPVSEPEAQSGLPDNGASITRAEAGLSRKLMSVFLVVLFALTGASLLLPPLYANIKLKEGLSPANGDRNRALASLAEATRLDPYEALYYGPLGYTAYSMAIAAGNADEKSKLLAISTAAYEAGSKFEPYLAYWKYVLADTYVYWANQGAREKLGYALQLYEKADRLFPENAVILDRWALALMLNNEYEEAGRKLQHSAIADDNWVQTSFLKGLLQAYEGDTCDAGEIFAHPVKEKLGNIGQYIGFCSQVGLYGGIEKVIEGMHQYVIYHDSDWIGSALLGIADVYGNKFERGARAFRDAVATVPPGNINLLKGVIKVMVEERKGFQAYAGDILTEINETLPVDNQ